jgi:hypothetical protein
VSINYLRKQALSSSLHLIVCVCARAHTRVIVEHNSACLSLCLFLCLCAVSVPTLALCSLPASRHRHTDHNTGGLQMTAVDEDPCGRRSTATLQRGKQESDKQQGAKCRSVRSSVQKSFLKNLVRAPSAIKKWKEKHSLQIYTIGAN